MNTEQIREVLNQADFERDLRNNWNTQQGNNIGKMLLMKLQEATRWTI